MTKVIIIFVLILIIINCFLGIMENSERKMVSDDGIKRAFYI